MNTKLMRTCAPMLPAPGDTVVLECLDEIERLRAVEAKTNSYIIDNARLSEDAARYRKLRRGQQWRVINGSGDVLRADELDAAVDAAADYED